MIRVLLVAFFICGLLFGFGEKPQADKSTKLTEKKEPVRPKIEATSEAQFVRGFNRLRDAREIGYPTYAEMAIEDFQNYLKYYPNEKERLDVLFWLNRAYYFLGDTQNQEKYLEQYFSEAPTDNKLYRHAELDKATVLARQGKTKEAAALFENLEKEFSEKDENWKSEIYKRSLSVYEVLDNKPKQAEIYSYFIKNKNRLDNQNLYPVYVYKYAKISYDLGDKQNAKKYFEEVIKLTPVSDPLNESSRAYLKKL